MNKKDRINALYSRLRSLGIPESEARQLRRIEMTLSRWSEAECNGEIERNETTGKPERVSGYYLSGLSSKRTAWPCPDRETGALRRLSAIMAPHKRRLWFYHQGDPRGCSLYVGRKADLPSVSPEEIARHSGERAARSAQSRASCIVSMYYTRGIAVCE